LDKVDGTDNLASLNVL